VADDRRLFVVAPHATRTGSTSVLIELLQRAAPLIGRPLAIEVLASGPRERELQEFGAPPRPGEVPAAVLVNSSLAAGVLTEVAEGVPTAVYVHEAAGVLADLPDAARVGILRADRVMCVSERARADVVAFGVPAERTVVVPPIVPERPMPTPESVAAARREMGASEGERLVVGCGEASMRKGTDLFLEVAFHLRDEPDVHLAWVGRRLRASARMYDHDVEAALLTGRVTWVGEVEEARPYLAAADLVVMPSREDPQPLVPLEAGLVQRATVGFDVDGLASLAEAGAARTVPFPDSPALADLVLEVLAAPEQRDAIVAASRAWAAERQSPDRVVPRFVDVIRALLADTPPVP
jgi:glycosyltransferase involved in cell wall biosynthesis